MSSGFWYYLGLFTAYTLGAVGLIYAVFWYLKKNGMNGLPMVKKSIQSQQGRVAPLSVESVLPLEARKNLYVVRSGDERFLIATTLEGTQFLSRLDNVSSLPETQPDSQSLVSAQENPAVGTSVVSTNSAECSENRMPLILQQVWSRLKPAR